MSDTNHYPVNDGTDSATDDSSVGLGNRPDEFLEDTSPHESGSESESESEEPRGVVRNDGPPEEPGIDKDRDLEPRVSAEPDSEVPD